MTSDSDPLLSRERGSDEEGSDSAVMQAKRIAPFLGSVVIMIPAFAFPYDISLYSSKLRESLGWSDSVVSWFMITNGIFMALAYGAGQHVKARGPMKTLWGAAAFFFVGFGCLFAGLRLHDSQTGAAFLAFFGAACIGQAIIWSTMTVLSVVARSVKPGPSVGVALGVLNLSIALGPVVYTVLLDLGWDGVVTGLAVIVTGVILTSLTLIFSPVVHIPSTATGKLDLSDTDSWWRLLSACVSLFALVIAYEASWGASKTILGWIVISVYTCFAFATLPLAWQHATKQFSDSWAGIDSDDYEKGGDEPVVVRKTRDDDEDEIEATPYLQAIQDIRYWVVFVLWMTIYGVGIGLYYSMSEIIKSGHSAVDDALVYNDVDISEAIVALSGGNAAARIVIGFASASFGRNGGQWWLVGAVFLEAVGLLWLSFMDFGVVDTMKPPLAIIGACFGAAYPLVPIIELSWFGSEGFSEYHALMYCSGIVGVLVIYRGLLLTLFENYSDENGSTSDCEDCFKVGFQYEAGLCLAVGFISGAVLWHHDKKAT